MKSNPPVGRKGDHVKRVGIIFSGGPAPGANAVISAAATSFLEDRREVIGFFHGYSNLQDYHPVTRRLLPDEHYRIFNLKDLTGLRNTRGIVIGTARAEELHAGGLASLDAAHLACAEAGVCACLVTCDDRFIRRARRLNIEVMVKNPVEYLEDLEHG